MKTLTENGYHTLDYNPFETKSDPYEELKQNQIGNLWEITRFIAGRNHKNFNHSEAQKAISMLAELRDLIRQD